MQTTIPNDPGIDGIIGSMIETLKQMVPECEKVGLTATADSISHALETWSRYSNRDALRMELTSMSVGLRSELKRRICFILPKISQELYEAPHKGWKPIEEVFPAVHEDVEEMNFCLAFGRYPAAVFHVLLVVEHGVIDLGKLIGVSDPKPGWDSTCKALEKIIQEGRTKAPRKLRKHFTFLELINKDILSMKMAWRNKVNHAA